MHINRLRSLWWLAYVALGCGAPVDETIVAATKAQDIIDGDPDHAKKRDGVVLLVGTHPTGRATLCTGTMLHPRVVLTAAHCLYARVPRSVACGLDAPIQLAEPYAPNDISVHVGASPLVQEGNVARGTKFFMPPGDGICDRDIALVVLDSDAVDIRRVLSVRSIATGSERAYTAVGYGRTEDGAIGERRLRDDVAIVELGPHPETNKQPWLGRHELETTTGPCSGDSGGPLLDAHHRVIGVVSRGADCRAERGHIYTRVDGFEPLIEQALRHARASP